MSSATKKGEAMFDATTAQKLLDSLIRDVTFELNSIKSQVFNDITMQVAIYSHDHIGARRIAFGVLSNGPGLDKEHVDELEEIKAVLLDREQRRNALKHLKRLIEEGKEEALQLLWKELICFFSDKETYGFMLDPEFEYPNEYVKPYPYSE
jgi:hypothetical protein